MRWATCSMASPIARPRCGGSSRKSEKNISREGNSMKRMQFLAGSCCALLLAATAHAADERVWYFDAGLGVGVARYKDPLGDAIHFLRDNGYERIGFSLDATAGRKVRPGLYMVGAL